MSSDGSFGKGSSRQSKRPAPLKMVKEEVRQYKPPVIIHTYSPKIIHVDAAKFSSLVQSLTGRGQKRKPEASPVASDFPVGDPFASACQSPNSSGDSGLAGILDGPLNQGLMSPRTPLPSFHDHLYQFDSSSFPSQAASDKGSSVLSNAVLAAAAATAASGGPQYSPLFSNTFPNSFPHLFSPLPSPNLLSPNFMADLPALSPSTYQAFDAFGGHNVLPSPGYGRFSNAGILPSPGSSNAFKDMALMMSRD